MAWDDDLHPQMTAYAIAASQEVRIRVIAGPGTGKSFAMKRRVARLLEDGVQPGEILAVTFTRVAADDLHRELTQLNTPGADLLRGRTLHSLGLHILNRNQVLEAIGRVARPLNRFEQGAMIHDLADAHGGRRSCKKLVKIYQAAWAKAQGDEPRFEAGSTEASFAIDVVGWLEFHRGMLIGEVVPYLLYFLHHNPACSELDEFPNILVDEYQDLNKAEQLIISKLAAGKALTIVGDDDQSIYSFKFAHPQGIREWHLQNQNVDDHALLDCHRCPTRVVDMANSLIDHNQQRTKRSLTPIPDKGEGKVRQIQFRSFAREAAWIADEIELLIQKDDAVAGEIIVLIQRGELGSIIMDELKARNVPCKSYYDESQLDTAKAQERFALLKLLLDEEDRVALRYLLGVGSSNMRAPAYSRLRAYCEANDTAPWDALVELDRGDVKLGHVNHLVARFREIRAELAELSAHEGDLAELVDALFPPEDPEVDDIRELALACAAKVADADALLVDMMEALTQPDVPPAVEEVRVMSLHKSKGLSSPVVFVAGCVEGILPQEPDDGGVTARQESLEEQRRLFFVALTRTKSDPDQDRPGRLYLTYSMRMDGALAYSAGVKPARYSRGVASFVGSRFLKELGGAAPDPEAVV